MAREQRYPSDLTDAEWVVVEPLLPAPTQHPRGGRPEKHPRRDIVDAILYVVRTGCAWRQLPVDFPPWETVYWYFTRWEQQKLTFRMVDALRAQVRTSEDRDPEPSAGLMDSQSVKGADTVGAETRGYDAGKKINGRKRFIVTDTLGLLLVVLVLPASVQDRDGAKKLLLELRHRQLLSRARRRVRHLFADGGFAGALVDWARTIVKTTIEVVRKPQGQKGFAVIPRRWAVERTFGWLTAYRRLARDYERHPATAEAIIRWAAIATMTRRITRGRPATRPRTTPLHHRIKISNTFSEARPRRIRRMQPPSRWLDDLLARVRCAPKSLLCVIDMEGGSAKSHRPWEKKHIYILPR